MLSKKIPKNYNTFEDVPVSDGTTDGGTISDFEDLLDLVGSYGTYQKWLTYVFLCPISFSLPLCFMNTVFIFSEPDHWCHVTPWELSAIDKHLWIPRVLGPDGQPTFSKCHRYLSPWNRTVIPCSHGWDYDDTDFSATLTSDYDWVCDKENYVTLALLAANLGGGPGALIFGWCGDRFGRKPTFFVGCFILPFFKLVSFFIPEYFKFFLLSQFLMGTTYYAILLASIQLTMECAGKDHLPWVTGIRYFAWIVGMCTLPLVAMVTRYWLYLGLATTLPLFLTLFSSSFVLESPRWLLSQGRLTDTETVLLEIARRNGTLPNFDSLDLLGTLIRLKLEQDEQHGGKRPRHALFTLFATWRLGRNTLLLSVTFAVIYMILYGINYDTTSLPGNQFLNYFLLAAIQFPVGYVAGIGTKKLGRRWVQTFFFGLNTVSLVGAAVASQFDDIPPLLISTLCVAKFSTGLAAVVVPLQATELLPTSVRANGIGLMAATTGLGMVAVPYILYTRYIHSSLPLVGFAALSLVATVASAFLPETLGTQLPETVDDASAIGAGSDFWSYLPVPHGHETRSEQDETPRSSTDK